MWQEFFDIAGRLRRRAVRLAGSPHLGTLHGPLDSKRICEAMNLFDRDKDPHLYAAYEAEEAAWGRAKFAFEVLAVAYVIIGSIAVDHLLSERTSQVVGAAGFLLLWPAWRLFKKICCARLQELDEIGWQRFRERHPVQAGNPEKEKSPIERPG
jgi:hypothetical protein